MKVGFIGLGNVGARLANTLHRNRMDLQVLDASDTALQPFRERGVTVAASAASMAQSCDLVITCLPSPAICTEVVEGAGGILEGITAGTIWAEMSTTDADEVKRLGKLIKAAGGDAVDCPVSGGCHRAATGNISILAGCDRSVFERILPVLTTLGRRVLHTGELGTASSLKVVTNYLATANLLSVCEALVTCKASGLDLNVAYEAIRVSSGNSFVHETEGQIILNGSRNIDFTMDLVLKDIGLFQSMAEDSGVELEISPLLIEIFKDGAARFGPRANSPSIIERLESQCGVRAVADGFPESIEDDEPEERGREVVPATAAR